MGARHNHLPILGYLPGVIQAQSHIAKVTAPKTLVAADVETTGLRAFAPQGLMPAMPAVVETFVKAFLPVDTTIRRFGQHAGRNQLFDIIAIFVEPPLADEISLQRCGPICG